MKFTAATDLIIDTVNTTGDVTLTATNGSIIDGGDNNVDIVAAKATLVAANGIGAIGSKDLTADGDVAVNDASAMCVRERFEHLFDEAERVLQRHASTHAVAERSFREWRNDDEQVFDERCILDRENVRMIELRCEPHLVSKPLQHSLRDEMFVRDL